MFKLLIWRIGALLVYGLSTDLRLDGNILKIRNVGLGWKRILRRSTEIENVEVDAYLNCALSLVVAGIVGILADGVSARSVASLKSGRQSWLYASRYEVACELLMRERYGFVRA
jgi:hypothetical protein